MPNIYEAVKARTCDVCERLHPTPEAAAACAAQLIPADEIPLPLGLILTPDYGPHRERRRTPATPDQLYAALVCGYQSRADHLWDVFVYWYRPSGIDDQRARRDIVNPETFYVVGHSCSEPESTNVEAPTFKRALSRCRALAYTPRILRQGVVVPYAE